MLRKPLWFSTMGSPHLLFFSLIRLMTILVCINCNDLCKWKLAFPFFKRIRFDTIFFEGNTWDSWLRYANKTWEARWCFFCPLENPSRGAAILITLCLVYTKTQIQSDNEGLFQMCFWKLTITRLTWLMFTPHQKILSDALSSWIKISLLL